MLVFAVVAGSGEARERAQGVGVTYAESEDLGLRKGVVSALIL